MNADKIIHEARGLCWHELIYEGAGSGLCTKCRKIYSEPPSYDLNPHDYCALMDWMLGKGEEFKKWQIENGYTGRLFSDRYRQEQITLIAEAIEAGVLS